MTGNRRRRRVTEDEERLWQVVVRDAKPLRKAPVGPPEPGTVEAAGPPVSPILPPDLSPPIPRPDESLPARPVTNPYLPLDHGRAPGVDRRTAERMKKGEMAIDATLDLHGMTQEAAHSSLHRFVLSCYGSGRRMVLIVTGKGSREGSQGVLRAQVPRWLNEPDLRPAVLAFGYAQPKHGGEGALYVLLRRKR